MSNIIVFGAAGRTGKEVVREALAKGHDVTAFTYSAPDSIFGTHRNLRIIRGNARSYNDVLKALKGHDSVINIIAPKLLDAKNYDISQIATQNIINAMKQTGAQRYIGQSGAWATDQINDASPPMRLAFKVLPPFRGIYGFKRQEDAIVKHSGLNWTLVRCGVLTNKLSTRDYRIFKDRYTCKPFEIPTISRKNVANFEVAILDDPTYYKTSPIIIE